MKNVQPTSVRLDSTLYERIKADAEKERRSVSAQIEYMLLQYYDMKKILLK